MAMLRIPGKNPDCFFYKMIEDEDVFGATEVIITRDVRSISRKKQPQVFIDLEKQKQRFMTIEVQFDARNKFIETEIIYINKENH